MEESSSLFGVLQEAWELMTWVEIVAVITGLAYIFLALKENSWCWPFGIISSALSIYVFYTGGLFAESILYFYYVIAGFYGWYIWNKQSKESDTVLDQEIQQQKEVEIHTWTIKEHGLAFIVGIALSYILGWLLQRFTPADVPYLDAFTTIFSFVATYMVTRKVLENWLYWIVLNLITIGMYSYKGYYLYVLLTIVYLIIAAQGYKVWKKRMSLSIVK